MTEMLQKFATDSNVLLTLSGLTMLAVAIFAVQFGRNVRWTHEWRFFPMLMKTLLTLCATSFTTAIYFEVGVREAIATAVFLALTIILGCGIGIGLRSYKGGVA